MLFRLGLHSSTGVVRTHRVLSSHVVSMSRNESKRVLGSVAPSLRVCMHTGNCVLYNALLVRSCMLLGSSANLDHCALLLQGCNACREMKANVSWAQQLQAYACACTQAAKVCVVYCATGPKLHVARFVCKLRLKPLCLAAAGLQCMSRNESNCVLGSAAPSLLT